MTCHALPDVSQAATAWYNALPYYLFIPTYGIKRLIARKWGTCPAGRPVGGRIDRCFRDGYPDDTTGLPWIASRLNWIVNSLLIFHNMYRPLTLLCLTAAVLLAEGVGAKPWYPSGGDRPGLSGVRSIEDVVAVVIVLSWSAHYSCPLPQLFAYRR